MNKRNLLKPGVKQLSFTFFDSFLDDLQIFLCRSEFVQTYGAPSALKTLSPSFLAVINVLNWKQSDAEMFLIL